MKFDRIDWNRVFFKTYFEKRSFLHLLVNFNRIWVIHISLYWFYTAFNSPTIYTAKGSQNPTAAMTWSATALGGAVATIIMILATVQPGRLALPQHPPARMSHTGALPLECPPACCCAALERL